MRRPGLHAVLPHTALKCLCHRKEATAQKRAADNQIGCQTVAFLFLAVAMPGCLWCFTGAYCYVIAVSY